MTDPARLLELAHTFVEEVRRDLEDASREGTDTPPRLRVVHTRRGQGSSEIRTLAIPIPASAAGSPPEVLSSLIARYSAKNPPTSLLLALDVEIEAGSAGDQRSALIAEARDRSGLRFFMMHPYRVTDGKVHWEEPAGGGWQDPGAEEMILDASFGGS